MMNNEIVKCEMCVKIFDMANQYIHIKNLFSHTILSDIFYFILFFFFYFSLKKMLVMTL